MLPKLCKNFAKFTYFAMTVLIDALRDSLPGPASSARVTKYTLLSWSSKITSEKSYVGGQKCRECMWKL